jgi:AcrR family transcriptional regulator
MRCVARRGLRKTTLDDVATDAGCSRATIYRAFPGGKDVLMAAATERETLRELAAIAERLDHTVTLEDTIVTAIHGAAVALTSNEAFVHVLSHEPGVVLPHLSFEGLDPVLARAVAFLAPRLERYVDATTARRTAEWAARLVVLYTEDPEPYDLTHIDDVHRLVALHILPGLAAASSQEHLS